MHGLSTVPARVHREFVERGRRAFEEQSWGKPDHGTHAEMIAEWDERVATELAKIAARAQLLCDTYVALIDLGDGSIHTEYFYRKRDDVRTS